MNRCPQPQHHYEPEPMEAAHEPEPEPIAPPYQAPHFSAPKLPIQYQAPLTPQRPTYQPPAPRTQQLPTQQPPPSQQQARAAAAAAGAGPSMPKPQSPVADDPFAANDLETPAFLRRVRNRMFQ